MLSRGAAIGAKLVKYPKQTPDLPVLFLDVDGVISLFGFREGYGLASGSAPSDGRPEGTLHSVNGILHYIRASAAEHLPELGGFFELVWASGWEETANDFLPHILGLPGPLHHLTFDGRVAAGNAHWKIEAIDEHAGPRPAAWIDDNLSDDCHVWAESREAPTLLIETERHVGMTDQHVAELVAFATKLK